MLGRPVAAAPGWVLAGAPGVVFPGQCWASPHPPRLRGCLSGGCVGANVGPKAPAQLSWQPRYWCAGCRVGLAGEAEAGHTGKKPQKGRDQCAPESGSRFWELGGVGVALTPQNSSTQSRTATPVSTASVTSRQEHWCKLTCLFTLQVGSSALSWKCGLSLQHKPGLSVSLLQHRAQVSHRAASLKLVRALHLKSVVMCEGMILHKVRCD